MLNDLQIKQYLEKGFNSKSGRFLRIFGKPYQRILAHKIFSKSPSIIENKKNTEYKFTIHQYHGKNRCAIALKELFLNSNHPAIVTVIVHGSIADENEICYSDFDGILVIDTTEIKSANSLYKLRELIKKTKKIIFQQDALQHHGWMILTKQDLLHFEDQLHPLHLLQKGSVLFPTKSITLQASICSKRHQYKNQLIKLETSILKKCHNLKELKNQYLLKNLLSEIMLLPVTFLQAQKGTSIQKKESFELLKSEYPDINLSLIDSVSLMRIQWTQKKVNSKTKLFHFLKESGISTPFLAPKTPKRIYQQLNETWKTQILELCENLIKKLD